MFERKASIKLTYSPADAGCVIHGTRLKNDAGEFYGTNHRVRLDAVGGVVTGCRARLIEVWRNGELVGENLVIPLRFAPAEAPDDPTRFLCPGVSEFIDLAFMRDDGMIVPWIPGWPSHLQSLYQVGQHRLKVAVTSSVGAAMLDVEIAAVSKNSNVTAFPLNSVQAG